MVNYLWQIQDGDIQYGVPLLSCVNAPLCPCSYIRPAAIFEGDIDNSRFTTVQPPRNHCPGGTLECLINVPVRVFISRKMPPYTGLIWHYTFILKKKFKKLFFFFFFYIKIY